MCGRVPGLVLAFLHSTRQAAVGLWPVVTTDNAGQVIDKRRMIWRELAEEMLNDVNWLSSTEARVECPGSSSHSDGKPDAYLYIDCVPTIHCFHQTCRSKVEGFNEEFRQEARLRERAAGITWKPTKDELAKWQAERSAREVAARKEKRILTYAREQMLPNILSRYTRPLDEWVKQSPHPVPSRRSFTHLKPFLEALPPDENIWIGGRKSDTGHRWHKRHFAPAADWVQRLGNRGGLSVDWQYICPSCFVPARNLCNRSAWAVRYRRLLVLEADALDPKPMVNKIKMGAIAEWLRLECYDEYQLRLFALVDSGNKSLHAWFSWPSCPPEQWEHLTTVLRGLGLDPHTWGLASCARLPGVLRQREDGGTEPDPVGWQRLYYFDPAALKPFEDLPSSKVTHPEHKPDLAKAERDSAFEAEIEESYVEGD